MDIASTKGKSGISDHFAVFRDVAGESANARAHRVQQRQRKTLQIGWQHEEHCVGEKIV